MKSLLLTNYLIFLGCLISSSCQANNTCIQLGKNEVALTEKLHLYEDLDRDTNFEIVKNNDLIFKPYDQITIKDAAYWGRVTLCNSNTYTHWSFRVNRNQLSHFNLCYFNKTKSKWITNYSGAFQPYDSQDGYFPIQSDYNHIDIRLDAHEEIDIYFYFNNSRKYIDPNVSVTIIPKDVLFYSNLNDWKSRTYLITGLFLFLIILGATFYYNTRDKAFLYYGLYLTSLLIWIYYAAGLFDDWLMKNIFPQHPENARLIGTVIVCYWFYISFIWHFGHINKMFEWGRKYFLVWSGYIAFFFPLIIGSNLLTKNIQIFFKFGLIFNLGMTLFTLRAMQLLWHKRHETDIRYVIIGLFLMFSLLAVASYEIVMNDFQIPKFSIISILFMIEIVFFLWALSQRYKNFLQYEVENEVISQSLKEKDTLLREIHHRVKNNLQVISALLTLQSKYVAHDEAKEALKVGEGRVHSMALIHQDLYQHSNLKGVNARDYFEKLINNLIASYKSDQVRLSLHCDIHPMLLDVDTMIPLGLVVNELTSNALKHAFTNTQTGNIYITLKEVNNTLQLMIRDDGKGATSVELESKSFGFSLIQSFARRLDADVDVTNDNGLSVLLQIRNYKMAG